MRGGFPFEIIRHMPNAVTQAAIKEAEILMTNPDARTFSDMEALKADLASDEDEDA